MHSASTTPEPRVGALVAFAMMCPGLESFRRKGFGSHLASFQGHKFHESEIIPLDTQKALNSVDLAENKGFLSFM